MRSREIEQRLTAKIAARLPEAAPGIQLQVHHRGEKRCDIALGETYAYYDLASLTKILFTVPALMAAYEKGMWDLETKARAFWPSFPAPNVTVKELLTHSSGALWWYPFYRELDCESSVEKRRLALKQKIETLEWKPAGDCNYSDVGMLVLGFCLEAMHSKPLLDIWRDLNTGGYGGLPGLTFHENNRPLHAKECYAPSENCKWRGRLLQGEVHDDNAWSFGGVSSHAGLFGGIDDVSACGLLLRSALAGSPGTLFKSETVKLFTARAFPSAVGNWAIGFMVPAPVSASCGQRFSPRSFGHTGFTGTSLWFDPNADVLITVLSNRVFFGRDRKNFRELLPAIHDWVMDELAFS